MRLLQLTARARLATLSALVVFGAVLGAVSPFVVQSAAEERRLRLLAYRSAVASLARAALPEDPVEVLRADMPFGGLARLGPGGVVLDSAGFSAEDLKTAAGVCEPRLAVTEVRIRESEQGLFACARLARAPEQTLVAISDESSALRQNRLLQAAVLAVALASLAAAIAMGAVRKLLSPLAGMTEAARQLARGDTQLQLPPPADPELVPLHDALLQLAAARFGQLDAIQQRLELTGQLAALVAHEVRNPLQSLMMLTDVVAHEPDQAARQALLQSIQQELATIETVVQRLLGSGGDLHLVRRPAALDEVVRRALALLEPSAREQGVRLEAEVAGPLRAPVDSALLRRALENVVRNAIALLGARGGGQVVVRLDEPRPNFARIVVDDSGEGVAAEDRERIFELGVSRRPGGSGLGLPLARMVARAHGGSLELGESPLGGARFVFEIPLNAEPV